MRAAIWTAVVLSLCVATVARAEDKPESAPAADAQTATKSEATEATPAPADEAAPAEAAEPAAAAKVEDAAPEAKPVESAPAPAEPARVEMAEPEKAPAAKAVAHGPFQGSWQDASADEKALFLESFGESGKAIQERWDKASPEERRKILRANPLLSARPMKHRWVAATPEERAAFLEANPAIADKAREAWQKMQPEMRATLVRKWQGWPLKAYQARLDSAGKTFVSVKTRPSSTNVKGTAKPAVHRQ